MQISLKHLRQDIPAGIIIALVSIPISMGYSQLAGLPAVYGLYGSFLPILVFALLTSSPQFMIGVDAMPAVMTGNLLAQLGIAALSEEALAVVPLLSVLCAVWFLVFRLVQAGRVVKYISTPVMAGFISGIGCTIILMQVPKLFGGAAGTGELAALLLHIASQAGCFHPLSALLGFGTIAVILISKRLKPSFPMTIVMMVIGILLIAVFHLDEYGVKTLSAAEGGLPKPILPDFSLLQQHPRELLTVSLTISLVIMAQTLLASSSYASKNRYTIDRNRELIAYAAMNLAGGLIGCCPINGSVSRTGMADQFKAKSQLTSLVAAAVMLLILLFGTGLLAYMPVPVLTGIVTTALIGIIDSSTAKRLWKTERKEFFIMLGAFLGVLLLGTIYGVVIGVVLSFMDVVMRAVVPPRTFLGILPGHDDFYNLSRTSSAKPVSRTIIYRFSGNLFFANFETFQEDLRTAIRPETKTVIIDGRGIASIDITAADGLLAFYRELKDQGIRLFLTEHPGSVNDSLREFGAEEMIEDGCVRRTIELALSASGLEPPYPIDGSRSIGTELETQLQQAEFEWLFGTHMEEKLAEAAQQVAAVLQQTPELELEDADRQSRWGKLGTADEDALLAHLELRLEQLNEVGTFDTLSLRQVEQRIEERRTQLDRTLRQLNTNSLDRILAHRRELSEHARIANPALYQKHLELRSELLQRLEEQQPELAKRVRLLHQSPGEAAEQQSDGTDDSTVAD